MSEFIDATLKFFGVFALIAIALVVIVLLQAGWQMMVLVDARKGSDQHLLIRAEVPDTFWICTAGTSKKPLHCVPLGRIRQLK